MRVPELRVLDEFVWAVVAHSARVDQRSEKPIGA